MKKLLSITLIVTILLSMTIIFAIPAAAVDGEWEVIPSAEEFYPDFDGEKASLSGYEYTEDGFHTIPTDAWKESNPYMSVQSKTKVDLKEGVYFEVRIDDFTYSSDKWFNMHIWDSKGIAPGSGDAKYGSGVQNLIRPTDSTYGKTPGTVSSAGWYINQFTADGGSTFVKEKNLISEEGHPILAMTVTWDGSTYAVDINGGAAPQGVIDFMNQKWGGEDSEAYIGINMQNANKGGTAEMTILKFGTSKDSATTPMGDDSEEPTNELIPVADIADPGTVPANEPAIFFNADRENSDTKNKVTASNGGYSTVNDDFSLHVIAERSLMTAASFAVKNEVSYDIKDFPVAITLTRNFCTCGNEDGSCDALESSCYFIMFGDVLAARDDYKTAVLDMSYNSYTVGEDTYLYFLADFSSEFGDPLEGRINGIRFDVDGLDLTTEGANTFDIMFTAFFRTEAEAEAYVEAYIEALGGSVGGKTEETTVETTEETTTVTIEETTEEKTENKPEQTTEKNEETTVTNDEGCASVLGFSTIAMVVTAASCGVLAFRKKRD